MICFYFFMICIYIFLSIFYALYNINIKSRVIPSEKVNFFIFFEKVENEYDKNRAGEMFLGAFYRVKRTIIDRLAIVWPCYSPSPPCVLLRKI